MIFAYVSKERFHETIKPIMKQYEQMLGPNLAEIEEVQAKL